MLSCPTRVRLRATISPQGGGRGYPAALPPPFRTAKRIVPYVCQREIIPKSAPASGARFVDRVAKIGPCSVDECLFERSQDRFGIGAFEQSGRLPINDREGGKIQRSVGLAGDCHDEQVRAMDMVSGTGNHHRRAFLTSLLIGERKGYEDDLAKCVCSFGRP
jgi:hypothetical protein